jgi:hypothetical protein
MGEDQGNISAAIRRWSASTGVAQSIVLPHMMG